MKRCEHDFARTMVLVTAVLAICWSTPASAGKLFPKCLGSVITINAPLSGDTPYLVTHLPWSSATISVNCLAFQVLTLSSGAGCEQDTLDTLMPYTLFVSATTAAGNYSWPVDDTVGGSVERLHFAVPSPASWTLWFSNTHPSKCSVQLQAVVETVGSADVGVALPAPALTLLSPTTIYEGKDTLLAFKVIGGASAGDSAEVQLLYGSQAGTRFALERETDPNVLSEYQLTDSEFSAWHLAFSTTGNFLVRYQRQGTTEWRDVAQIIAYGANPAFFVISDGAGPDGELYLEVESTITFYGDHLNSAPNGDRAKFVDQITQACDESAPPAGGVPLATSLGPLNDVNVSQTTWTFTLTKGGMFRVCYSRFGSSWQEVASRDDLPDLGPSTEAPEGSVPIPTDPDTKLQCEVAPARQHPPTYDTFLTLKLNTNVYNHAFAASLAKFLCIKPNDLSILDMDHYTFMGESRLSIDIDIVCKRYGRDDLCSGAERKNYMLFLWNNRQAPLTRLGIVEVEERSAEGVFGVQYGDSGTLSSQPRTAVVAVVCFTILGVVGMAVYAFVRYQQGHRFIQVGHSADEAEEDENALDTRGPSAPSPKPPNTASPSKA